VLVDAADGLAFPACALAVGEAIARAREHGVAFAGVKNSHHFGVAAGHLERSRPPAWSASPSATRRRRCRRGWQAGDLRHQPDRRGVPAPQCAAARDRPLALGSRARESHGRCAGRQADSARLGARQGRQPDDRREAGARGDDASRGGAKGAMLALVRWNCCAVRSPARTWGSKPTRSSSRRATARESDRHSWPSTPCARRPRGVRRNASRRSWRPCCLDPEVRLPARAATRSGSRRRGRGSRSRSRCSINWGRSANEPSPGRRCGAAARTAIISASRCPREASQTVLDVVTYIQRHLEPALGLSLRLPRGHVRLVRDDGERRRALDLPHPCRESRAGRPPGDRPAAQPAGDSRPRDRHAGVLRTSGRAPGASSRPPPRAGTTRRPSHPRRASARPRTPGSNASAAACATHRADVVAWNPDYLGPAALNRAWTLVNDRCATPRAPSACARCRRRGVPHLPYATWPAPSAARSNSRPRRRLPG